MGVLALNREAGDLSRLIAEEARHIRGYKVSAEREASLYEQIVLPLLKQRNPDARRRAEQTVVELVRLGEEMRRVLLRRGLREHLPPT